MLPKYKSTCTV